MRAAVIVIIVGVLAALAGCGSAVAGAQGQATGSTATVTMGSQRSTSDPTSGEVTLTVADNGKTIHLHIGQRLRVVLGGGGARWHHPASFGPTLRLVTTSGGYPTGHPAVAVFLAVRAGTAIVVSAAPLSCLHAGPRCTIAARVWRVHVLVVGSA